MSCSRTQHSDPSGARTPDLWIQSLSGVCVVNRENTVYQSAFHKANRPLHVFEMLSISPHNILIHELYSIKQSR